MTAVALLEINSLTEFQKELHSAQTDDEKITSIFYHEFQKTTWRTDIPARLKHSTTEENIISFTVNTTFHFLKTTCLIQEWPPIEVKPEYRDRYKICWTHNPGINVVEDAEFTVNDDDWNWLDYIWLAIYFQYYCKPGFREHWNMCVGNVPFMEEWNYQLPRYRTTVPQPWFYAWDISLAFPLFYGFSDNSIVHTYRMRRKISDLLRMITTRDGGKTWVPIPPDFSVLSGASASTQLPIPEMWGYYDYTSDNEVGWYKCRLEQTQTLPDGTQAPVSKPYSYYITDVMACDVVNPTSYGIQAEVELFCETPCKALFWVAENQDAVYSHNYTNFTTDSSDVYAGWNPVKEISLRYKGIPRLKKMRYEHFERMQPWHHFPSPPSEPGYNVYSFADNSCSLDAEVGVMFTQLKAKLFLSIQDTNPWNASSMLSPLPLEDSLYSEEEEKEIVEGTTPYSKPSEELKKGPYFLPRARLLVMKKVKIEKKKEKIELKI